MKTHLRTRISAIAVAIAMAGMISACDNPVENNDQEHAEAEGLVLLDGDVEIVRVEDGATDDTLFVPFDALSAEYTMQFLDHDGHEIHTEDLQEDFDLGWEVSDTDVVSFEQRDAWTFVLEGRAADTTSLTLMLMHLPQRHEDFTTPDIPVVVR